jgi:uncharacterized membrane protein
MSLPPPSTRPARAPGAPDAGPASPAGSLQARMDTLIGTLLMIGVMTSLALIAAGVLWSFLSTGHMVPNYRIAGMNFFRFAVMTASAARSAFSPKLLIDAGIVVLMLTPLLRVFASMIYFLAVRNPKYAAFTAFVLAVLAWSLFLRA